MLPHFCATGACIHVLIIALYICQRNILIVRAVFDAVALCISGQDKRERIVDNAHQQFKRQAAKKLFFLI